MVTEVNPDIAAISEAFLQYEAELHAINIPDYRIITTKDYKPNGMSQLVVLVKNDFNVKILEDKMEEEISSIWLEIPRKGQQAYTLGAIYREHHRLLPQPNQSGDIQAQRARWSRILSQWTAIQAGRELYVIGDFNLDKLRWTDPDQFHQQMVTETRDKIEILGYVQMVDGPTRFWWDTALSLIDHLWTNCPQKLFIVRMSRSRSQITI